MNEFIRNNAAFYLNLGIDAEEMIMETDWIPGWTHRGSSKIDLFVPYKKECEAIIEICRTLTALGAMPEIEGRSGRVGNVGVRDRASNSGGHIITGSKTDKEFRPPKDATADADMLLAASNLVLATLIDWREQVVCSSQDEGELLRSGKILQPSTEILPMGQFFRNEETRRAREAKHEINVCIHCHWLVAPGLIDRICCVKTQYPVTSASGWVPLRDLARYGAREIGLLGHTNPSSNELDAVFVLGSDPRETLKRAVRLIEQSPLVPRS